MINLKDDQSSGEVKVVGSDDLSSLAGKVLTKVCVKHSQVCKRISMLLRVISKFHSFTKLNAIKMLAKPLFAR